MASAAARLGLSQSRLSAAELNPGTLSVAQLLSLCSLLGLELMVQPRGTAVAESRARW